MKLFCLSIEEIVSDRIFKSTSSQFMTILFSMEHEIKNKTEGKKTRFLQLPKNILRIAWRFGVFCITLQRHPEDCDVSRPA